METPWLKDQESPRSNPHNFSISQVCDLWLWLHLRGSKHLLNLVATEADARLNTPARFPEGGVEGEGEGVQPCRYHLRRQPPANQISPPLSRTAIVLQAWEFCSDIRALRDTADTTYSPYS